MINILKVLVLISVIGLLAIGCATSSVQPVAPYGIESGATSSAVHAIKGKGGEAENSSGRSTLQNPSAENNAEPPVESGVITAPTGSVTESASSSDWSTFTDSLYNFSIQYPNNIGTLTNFDDPDGAKGVELVWSETDFYVFIGYEDATDQDWLVRSGDLNTDRENVAVNGMKGVIYSEADGSKRAFVTRSVEGLPIILQLYLSNKGDPLPPFWHQILNSFQVPGL